MSARSQNPTHTPPPCSRKAVVDRYFLEHRAKVLDIAAFLDRVDRAVPGEDEAEDDYRVEALRRCVAVLLDGEPERARRVLEVLSERSVEPVEVAGEKGAAGAAADGNQTLRSKTRSASA